MQKNPIDIHIEKIVKKVIDSREEKLKKEDAEEIVKAIIPKIETIVSNIILKHIKALAVYVQTNFKDPEEK